MNRKFALSLVPILGAVAVSLPLMGERIVFPQAAVGPVEGGNLVIELRLGNTDSTQSWQGALLLLDNHDLSPMTGLTVFANGEDLGINSGSFELGVNPGESVIYRITSQLLQTGVLIVESNAPSSVDSLVSSFTYLLKGSTGEIIDVIAVQGALEARSGYRLIGSAVPTFDTGIAAVAKRSIDAVPGTGSGDAESRDPQDRATQQNGGQSESIEVQVVARVGNGTQYAGSFTLGGDEDLQKALFPYSVIPELPRDANVTQFRISSDELHYVTTLLVGAPPDFATVQIGAAPAEPDLDTVPYTGLNVDTEDRDSVVEFYRTFYLASEGFVAKWTGDEDSCQPGAVPDAFNRALLRRINYFRAMAGAPGNLVLDDELNAKAQAAALMMVANNRAEHDPQPSWICYSDQGAEASAKSNLFYLGRESPSVSNIVDGFIRDAGLGNSSAGHRRWVLYPRQRAIGSGTVVTAQDAANALWVVGDFGSGPLVQTAWPPAGYVPYELIFERWSFSYPEANFSEATVTMDRGSELPVGLTVEPVANGFGDNSIVWVPDAFLPDSVYNVTISNVRVNGLPREFSYQVQPIDPDQGTF